MAIKKRPTKTTSEPLQTSAPADNSVLPHLPVEHRKAACIAVYGNTPPTDIPTQDLLAAVQVPNNPGDDMEARYRRRIRNRGTGIRAFCVDCAGGSARAVKGCLNVECALWAYRMGGDPFRGRS